MKKISIIVPVYNGSQRILKCLDSIMAQTYHDIEVIILNDGSNDSSNEIIRLHMERFLNSGRTIKYEYHINQGVAKTRNHGIDIATGDYITFVDQDDYLTQDYVENYMKYVQQEEYDVVVGGYKRISDEEKVSRVVSLVAGEEWSKFVVTAPWAHVYKADLLRKYDIKFLTTGLGEDVYFNLLVYSYTDKVKVISDSNYMWVDNPKSVSNSKQNTIRFDRSPLYLMNKLIEKMPTDNAISYEYLEFYFARYVAWYFLFTVRGSKADDVVTMYDLLDDWMKKHFPNHLQNRNISLFKPKGDLVLIRMCVYFFYLLKKICILRPILVLIAKIT